MTVKELSSAPNLPRMYATSVVSMLPVIGSSGSTLPDLEIKLADVEVDQKELAEYDRVCGLRLGDTLPSTYIHILAFPLAVQVMTDRSFPFPLAGMVHIANRITQFRPVGVNEKLTLSAKAERLRPHDKGQQFDMITEARVGDELVWRGESTYLHRGKGGGEAPADLPESLPGSTVSGELTPPAGSSTSSWTAPTDIGRKYGRVSGDVNPIHLHPLAARLFGFPRHIAHGMWSHARAIGALEGKLPDSYVADVRFLKPMLLPAKLEFASWDDAGGFAFTVRDAKKQTPHVVGTIRPNGKPRRRRAG